MGASARQHARAGTRPHTLQVTPTGAVVEVAAFDTLDGLYDCCWSESNENIIAAASGDGSIKVRARVWVGVMCVRLCV